MVTGAVSTAKDIVTDIASGGLSAIGKLVGIGGDKSATRIDDTDYCEMALAGRPVVRAKAKPQPQPASSLSPAPPPATQGQETPSASTLDKVDKTLDGIGKSIGGVLKGLFGN